MFKIVQIFILLLLNKLSVEKVINVNNSKLENNLKNFWHVTDMHFDLYYNSLNEVSEVCPSSNGVEAINPGIYGDYRCDAPWKLILSAVNEMKRRSKDLDFIIWTGDDTLHTDDEDKYLSEDLVIEIIANQTELLKSKFPGIPIFPSIGNHDYHKKNQMPVGESYILSGLSEIWCPLLPKDQCEHFRRTGSYKAELPSGNGWLISLNTVIWYKSNHLIDGSGDPNNQFEWLNQTLFEARTLNIKVYIIGHIPPGYFELVDDVYWLYPKYNQQYTDMIAEYSGVVNGQFFGHHHTDSYRMMYDQYHKAVGTIWIAPGVTPWMTNLPGVVNGANNPGIRLFTHDVNTLQPIDYIQYYLELEEANIKNEADWKVEYQASTSFNLIDISLNSMELLTSQLQADVTSNSELIQMFARFNSVSYVTSECDLKCRRQHVCAIVNVNSDSYQKCISAASFSIYQSFKNFFTFGVSSAVFLMLYK